jgi:hypothetical protein
MEAIRSARLRNQRLSGARFSKPEDVVSWMGAVQAQEYADAKWALALRMERAGEPHIEHAFAEGRILRTHVLRPTWHFVVPADIRWMLALTAPHVTRRMAPYSRRLELDASVFRRSEKAIARALAGGAQLTRQELKRVLQQARVNPDGFRLAHIVIQAELDGLICSGPRRGRHHTYMLLDDRVPASRPWPREEALAELARRYFTSHGPAQLQDFAWWSGLPMTDARAALSLAGRDFARDVVDGNTYWLAPSRRARSASTTAFLLPLYDEYLIAYKDRSAALDRVFWTWRGGDPFSAAVIIEGRVVATWKRKLERGRVAVTVTPFAPLERQTVADIAEAARAYADFNGVDLVLTWTPGITSSASRYPATRGE